MLSAYTLLLHLFRALFPVLGLFAGGKFSQWLKTRDQWKQDVSGFNKTDQVIWFHCASVGEFEQARPIIERLKQSGKQIVLTFFSPSGYELRKDYDFADLVTYLPLDLPSSMNQFIDAIEPDVVLFVKYEFWFNAMQVIKDRAISMILISAYLTDKHWTTQWPGIHLGERLSQFDKIFAQDQSTVNRLKSVFIDNGVVAGDTRIDRVLENAVHPFDHAEIRSFCTNAPLLVVGSNWSADDRVILPVLKKLKALKVIVAPHEMNEAQKKDWTASFGQSMRLLSKVTPGEDLSELRVLYVDQIGMLSKLYRYAHVSYVGGGFGKAAHNTLEAAVFGKPVLFGPNNKRFQEIQVLKEIGAGLEVKDTNSFAEALDKALTDEGYRSRVETELTSYFQEQAGASSRILDWIDRKLDRP